MHILEVRQLKKRFKDVQAVNGLSMAVEQGEIHGILGPNGAGKSTSIGCMLGLVPYDSGEVIFEERYHLKEWRRYIGYVPQEIAVYDELTAEQNVKFFCSLYGTKNIQEKVEKALDFVGLIDVRNKKSGTFSGGMKRRLNLACGIVHEPKLIIMDEPTVGIDPQSRNRILENVKKLNEAGASILYTSHYMPEIEEICSKMTVVDHGVVITSGTKQEISAYMDQNILLTVPCKDITAVTQPVLDAIRNCSGVSKVEVSGNAIKIHFNEKEPVIDAVIQIAAEHQLHISDISTTAPSLEEMFLEITGKTLRDSQA